MGDRSDMSIFADSPLDEILNRGPLALLLRRQYEFPFGIKYSAIFIFIFIFIFNIENKHDILSFVKRIYKMV